MDESLTKTMKVIMLRDEMFGCYLTASDDEESITISRPDMAGWNSRNTEWRIEWLNHCNGNSFVGQVRLWSIHNKVLCLEGDPDNYTYSRASGALYQVAWRPDIQKAAEWRLEFRRKSNKLVLEIFKWSDNKGQMRVLSLFPVSGSYDLSFGTHSRKPLLKWLNGPSWEVEVVETCNELALNSNYAATATHIEKTKDHKNHSPGVVPATLPHYQRDDPSMMISGLSKWQVGQVYITLPPASLAGASQGYVNAGGNTNGSGVQKNGDVTVSNEIGRNRDTIATFVNYKG